MIILAIETATEACSVALHVNDNVISRFEVCPQQQSQRVLPMVQEVLDEANVDISQVELLAYGRGPGSFTGVRIATGIIQGLALGTGLKVVGISTMAAMAQQVIQEQNKEHVVVAIDARMQEVYFSQYKKSEGLAKLVGDEQVLKPSDAINCIELNDFALAGTGWGAYPELSQLNEQVQNVVTLYPNAKFILPLAKHLALKGEAKDIEQEQPVYLRDTVTWKKLPGRE